MNKTLISLALASTIVCIGSLVYLHQAGPSGDSADDTGFARFAIATPVLIALTSYARDSRKTMRVALTKNFWQFSLLGLSGVTLLYVFQFYSLRFISATKGSVIINLHAVFAMLLSAVFLKEPLTSRKTVGVLVAFSGVIVITLRETTPTSLKLIEPVGVLLMVGAALCWATYSVFGKKALRLYSNQVVSSCVFLLGTLCLIPFAISEDRMVALVDSSWVAWLSLVFLAIPCSVVAYLLWNRMIHELDVTKVLVSLYVIPIPTAILSYVFLGERITYPLILGAAFVIAGVYLTESSRKRQDFR